MRVVVSSGSRTWGGLESMAEILARGLAARGHEVVLFCREGSPLHERLRGDIPCEPVLRGSYFHPLTVPRCMRALQRHRAEVVIGNTMKDPSWTGLAARLLGVPYVYRHEFNLAFADRARDRLLYGRIPSLCLVVSRAAGATVTGAARWVSADRVRVVANGVDVGMIDEAPPAALALPDGGVVFGFVGRLEEAKGIRELAAAWPRVHAVAPDAHLAIAGFGPAEGELRSWLEGSPHVHWLGFRHDIPSVMKRIDVLVAPSHGEGFGLVLVEAMAAGTPVISTDTSAIPELVSDGVEGRLVPVGDVDALRDAMVEMAGDGALRVRMGAAGRARARRDFSVDRMLDEHERLLLDLAASRAAPAR